MPCWTAWASCPAASDSLNLFKASSDIGLVNHRQARPYAISFTVPRDQLLTGVKLEAGICFKQDRPGVEHHEAVPLSWVGDAHIPFTAFYCAQVLAPLSSCKVHGLVRRARGVLIAVLRLLVLVVALGAVVAVAGVAVTPIRNLHVLANTSSLPQVCHGRGGRPPPPVAGTRQRCNCSRQLGFSILQRRSVS